MYSVWAEQRRLRIQLVSGIVGFVLLFAYVSYSLYAPPTCFDKKKNGDEVGIDCGGPCSTLCVSQTQNMITKWARAFRVSPEFWSVLAYVENPNFNAYAKFASYRFRVYDETGVQLLEKVGTTYIMGDPIVPVFEGRLEAPARDPYRVTFQWIERPTWTAIGKRYQVELLEQRVVETNGYPEVRAVIKNTEPVELRDVIIIAIIYDEQQNAVASSQTYVDLLEPRGQRNLTFTWPEQFSAPAHRIELVARIPEQE